ncbi:hypothetical protein, partial [Pricia sp.]|uniref:hypothetical protein n=1 Tax=Pricia sp. TaxID=2268138 RepID=UPI0035947C0E
QKKIWRSKKPWTFSFIPPIRENFFHTSFRHIHFPFAPAMFEIDLHLHGKYSKIYAPALPDRNKVFLNDPQT